MHDIRSTLVRKETHVPLATKGAGQRNAGGLAAVKIKREETRKVDQRREDRHIGIIETALLRHQRRAHEVQVLNVSARGAMVRSELVPRIGARMDIQFSDCNRTECFVRWVRGGRIGLEFAKETLIIGANDSARRVSGRRNGEHPTLAIKAERAPRQCLMLRGELHWSLGSMPVRLRNISRDGAMLEGTQDLDPAAPVVLEMAGGVAIEGEVRWCRSRQIGVRFAAPFDPALLAHPHHDDGSPQVDYVKPDYLKSDGQADSPWSARWEKLSPDDL